MTRPCRPATAFLFSFVDGESIKLILARLGSRVHRRPRSNAFYSNRFRVQKSLVDWLRVEPIVILQPCSYFGQCPSDQKHCVSPLPVPTRPAPSSRDRPTP